MTHKPTTRQRLAFLVRCKFFHYEFCFHPLVTYSALDPNILTGSLFSDIADLYSKLLQYPYINDDHKMFNDETSLASFFMKLEYRSSVMSIKIHFLSGSSVVIILF